MDHGVMEQPIPYERGHVFVIQARYRTRCRTPYILRTSYGGLSIFLIAVFSINIPPAAQNLQSGTYTTKTAVHHHGEKQPRRFDRPFDTGTHLESEIQDKRRKRSGRLYRLQPVDHTHGIHLQFRHREQYRICGHSEHQFLSCFSIQLFAIVSEQSVRHRISAPAWMDCVG